MRRFVITIMFLGSLIASRVHGEELDLLNGRSLELTPSGGSVTFLRESGVTDIPLPTCPGGSTIQIQTSANDSGAIPLDCSKWVLERGKLLYSDPQGSAGGVTSINWKSTKMTVKFGGSTFDFSDYLGPIDYVDVRLTIGPDQYATGLDSFCARFTTFSENSPAGIEARGPSQSCGAPPPTPPAPPVTTTPMPTHTTGPTLTIPPTLAATPTPNVNATKAFHFVTLALQDPAIVVPGNCGSIINNLMNASISAELTDNTDTDPAHLDFALANVFHPLTQVGGQGGNVDIGTVSCSAAAMGRSCGPVAPNGLSSTTYTNTAAGGGSCVGTIAGTLGANHGNAPYAPIQIPQGPCFSSTERPITFTLGGIPIPMLGVRFAGQYNANPATGLTSGLIRGFVTEAAASNITIPMNKPLIGGRKLSQILRGSNCAATDDRDTVEGVSGWWFYLNYTASAVSWTNP